MEMKQLLMYAVPIGIAGAVIYYFATKQPAAAGAAPVTAAPSQMLPAPQDTITRGLIPTDLGVNSWNFALLANTWNTVVNTTVPRGVKSIKFTGISYGGTNASQIRITAGTSVREVWPIKFVAGLQSQLWYDDSPSTALENQPVIIDVYATGAATETISIMGEVAEIRGRTIA
jgi:hypothetical protein